MALEARKHLKLWRIYANKTLALLELTIREVVKGEYIQKVEEFISEINRVTS